MRTKAALIFALSALVSAMIGYRSEAQALHNLYPAAFCQIDTDSEGTAAGNYAAATSSPYSSSGLANAGATTTYWHCPMVNVAPDVNDGDGLEHSEVMTINVHGNDPNLGGTRIGVRACLQQFNATGGDCDTSVASATGVFTASLTGATRDLWTTAGNNNHFPYLLVYMLGNNNGARVYGYWIST